MCEGKPRKNAATIVADGKPLRPPPAEIRRIVVLGDTGCRIKKKKTQDCDNPAEWPYRALARRAADAKPDLVLHVGDYLYPEKHCTKSSGCPRLKVGYGWDIWNEDFFDLATPNCPLQGHRLDIEYVELRGTVLFSEAWTVADGNLKRQPPTDNA